MIHAKHRTVRIAHPDRMPELAHPEHREGVGLRLGEHPVLPQHIGERLYTQLRSLKVQKGHGKHEKRRQTDRCNQRPVKAGTGEASPREKTFGGFPRRLTHQRLSIVFIHSEC